MHYRYHVLLVIVTLAACVLLISPGNTWWVADSSNLLGGTDETDTRGHIALFAVLTLAWAWTLRHQWARPWISYLVVGASGIALGAITEVAQHFIPERGSNLTDFGADVLGTLIGVVLAALFIRWLERKKTPAKQPVESS